MRHIAFDYTKGRRSAGGGKVWQNELAEAERVLLDL
jgi:hypothetical protein